MTKSILILNGPNLNLLGTREPTIYGRRTLKDAEALWLAEGDKLGLAVECRQSNSEGDLVTWLQEAGRAYEAGTLIGVVLNAGGYTCTSIALLDAIKSTALPVIEVHVSNVYARESFRHHSFISPAARGIIVGCGIYGYVMAINALVALTETK
jgi:3-dehydroquinate dehydratase-2